MSENPNSVNDRLQQANQGGGGAPQINPDEQRKYLGTFRERVSLAIKNKDLASSYAQKAVNTELKNNSRYNLVINANNSMTLTIPYVNFS